MKMNAFKQRGGLAVALLAAAMALSACGGGKQVKKFAPSNIVSFGDESSAFVPDTNLESGSGTIKGLKYTVNDFEYVPAVAFSPALPASSSLDLADYEVFPASPAVEVGNPVVIAATPPAVNASVVTRVFNMIANYTASGATTKTSVPNTNVTYRYIYNCGDTSLSEANRLWIQTLASSYGMSYNQSCPLDPRGNAVSYAAAGAKVADVVTQISTNLAAVNSNTLVTVLAGQNDILERYEALYSSASPPDEGSINIELSELKNRGKQLGQAINSLASKGARTLVVSVPDLSYSPRVGADTAKQAVMKRLVVAFNEAIFDAGGARIDGRLIGLVNGFDLIGNMAKSPIPSSPSGSANIYGLTNVSSAACAATGRTIDTVTTSTISSAAQLQYCNDLTLVPGASAYNYLWAFDTWLTPRGHDALAGGAFARADNDTF